MVFAFRFSLKLPPVETNVPLGIAETNIEIVDTSGTRNLRAEGLVLVDRACALDSGRTNDGTVLTVQAQRHGAACLSSSGGYDAELFGPLTAEVDTTQTDIFSIVDIEDIHILLTNRLRHILDDTRILDAHLG